jgi:hypothetical protein
VGLALFLGVWFSTFRSAGLLRKSAKGIPEAQWAQDLGAMVQVSLIGYAIGGAFLSLPYFDFPYDLMVMAVLARDWVKRRAWETEPAVPFLQTLGFGKRRQPSGVPAARPGGSPASFVRPRGTGAGRAGDQRLNR